nr:zinc knuckle CX2CX4HX4C [Tanacetum cinerariifolium]
MRLEPVSGSSNELGEENVIGDDEMNKVVDDEVELGKEDDVVADEGLELGKENAVAIDKGLELEPEVVPLWIKMFDIPLKVWTTKGISTLSSSLGKPLIMDDMTTQMCQYGKGRIGYARVLVEVSVCKDFKEFVEVQYRDNKGGDSEVRPKTAEELVTLQEEITKNKIDDKGTTCNYLRFELYPKNKIRKAAVPSSRAAEVASRAAGSSRMAEPASRAARST